MYKRILVPLDGSALAEQVLPVAIQLAHVHHAIIYLTQINDLLFEAENCKIRFNTHLTKIVQRHLILDEAYLTKLARKLRDQQIEVRTIVCTGEIVPTLLEISDIYHCDLILLSSQDVQNNSTQCLNTITQNLLTASRIPVLVHSRENITQRELVSV